MSLAAIRIHPAGTGPPPPVPPRGPDGPGAWTPVHTPARPRAMPWVGLPLGDRVLVTLTERPAVPQSGGAERGGAVYHAIARRTVAVEGPVRPLDLVV